MSACRASRVVASLLLASAALSAAKSCRGARIEAVAGKTYTITKQHGPWMIMVASFHSTAVDGEVDEGKTPQQAASDLVYELRTKGIPAYIYEIEPGSGLMQTIDRLGQPTRRRNLRNVKSLCVLAGNYPSIDDDVAQKTLAWLKKFEPNALQEGVAYATLPGSQRQKPLSGAFLCMNPLLSAEEVAARRVDPLLRQLNTGMRHSLADNPGEYTLLVAHFGGKTVTEVKHSPLGFDFLKDNDLDAAAIEANDLAAALRQDLDPQPGSPFRNLEAYVWHDRNESIVTVGSFQRPDDPAIQHYIKMFSPAPHPTTGEIQPRYLAIGEKGAGARVWAFVPTPQLIVAPKLR